MKRLPPGPHPRLHSTQTIRTPSSGGFKRALPYGAGAALALITLLIALSCGPDRTLEFDREVRSEKAYAELSYQLGTLSEWPKWFQSLESAEIIDPTQSPALKEKPVAATGARILLKMDPHKGAHRRFEIIGRIVSYDPGRKLVIDIENESSGRLMRLFDRLTWSVELLREGSTSATLLIGHETAHTANWRGRLFGRIAERILLNQAFYPDMIVFADPMPPPLDLMGQ
jgi:hypothetical protein